MRTLTIPARSKTVNSLLSKARRQGLILKLANGQRFILTTIDEWEGFEVGEESDFANEVKLTVQNKRLMKTLSERRSGKKRISFAKVKQRLLSE